MARWPIRSRLALLLAPRSLDGLGPGEGLTRWVQRYILQSHQDDPSLPKHSMISKIHIDIEFHEPMEIIYTNRCTLKSVWFFPSIPDNSLTTGDGIIDAAFLHFIFLLDVSLQKVVMNGFLQKRKKGQNWSIKYEKQKYKICIYCIYVYTNNT